MKETSKSMVVGIATPLFLFLGIGVMYFVFSYLNVDLKPILTVVIALTPIWLPLTLFYVTFEMWQWGMNEKFKYKSGRTTLRIKLPQEVLKSPEAMESVFNQIHNPSRPDNYMQTYFEGRHPLIYSFELVSIGGEVRFYINAPTKKGKNVVEAQLYAQYPGIEIIEEPIDYTAEVVYNEKEWDMISFHLTKKEDDVYPIKTYIDFGMDKLPKEELKFEPMSPLIEHLGKCKPNERIWVQMLCSAHAPKNLLRGNLKEEPTWEKRAAEVIDKIMKRDKEHLGVEETENRPTLTLSERDTVAAIERNTSKYAYDMVIRATYLAKVGHFDAEMISPLLRSFAQYDVIGRNSIGTKWRTDFDYNFFSDFSGQRKRNMRKTELEYYKHRFYLPGDKKSRSDKMRLFSSEELATIYHIPGTSVLTPNLSRIESTRKEAPPNLPIDPNS